MNGPQHYAEAERLLAESAAPDALAAAQVHATLALAAATVAPRAVGPLEAWGGHHFEVLSPAREHWDEVAR